MRLVTIILLSCCVQAQQTFTLPRDKGDVPPVGYLERMEVGDASRHLSDNERHQLCRLFVRAYIVTVRSYPGLYMMRPSAPPYKLFKSNFPQVVSREDPEQGVSLHSLVRYINSLSEYKVDVDQVLRESLDRKRHCRGR